MGVVLRRLADLARHAAQFVDQAIEVARHARQFGHGVTLDKGRIDGAAQRDFVGDVAEAAQAQSHAQRHQHGQRRAAEIDRGGDADLAGLPVGTADRRIEKVRGDVRGRQDPAIAAGADRDDRRQQLDRAVGPAVAHLVGGVPGAGLGQALEDAALAQFLEFDGHGLQARAAARSRPGRSGSPCVRPAAGTSASAPCRCSNTSRVRD